MGLEPARRAGLQTTGPILIMRSKALWLWRSAVIATVGAAAIAWQPSAAQAPVQGRVIAPSAKQSIDARLRRVEQSSRAALSLLTQIDALRREVQELRNANEQLANRLGKAEQRLERVARNNANRPAAPSATAPAGNAAAQPSAGSADPEAQRQYEAAVDQLMAARYPQAASAFETFLQANSGSRFAGKAQYFLAESYYQQGKSRAALGAYQQLLSRHPNDAKVPESGLKIADLLDELGQRKEAAAALQAVIKNHPGTSFETMARQRLAELR
jgi:tol-pal system protein YbgF